MLALCSQVLGQWPVQSEFTGHWCRPVLATSANRPQRREGRCLHVGRLAAGESGAPAMHARQNSTRYPAQAGPVQMRLWPRVGLRCTQTTPSWCPSSLCRCACSFCQATPSSLMLTKHVHVGQMLFNFLSCTAVATAQSNAAGNALHATLMVGADPCLTALQLTQCPGSTQSVSCAAHGRSRRYTADADLCVRLCEWRTLQPHGADRMAALPRLPCCC